MEELARVISTYRVYAIHNALHRSPDLERSAPGTLCRRATLAEVHQEIENGESPRQALSLSHIVARSDSIKRPMLPEHEPPQCPASASCGKGSRMNRKTAARTGTKKVTVFVGSARRKGATSRAASTFLEQLESRGDIQGEIVFLSDYDLGVCTRLQALHQPGRGALPARGRPGRPDREDDGLGRGRLRVAELLVPGFRHHEDLPRPSRVPVPPPALPREDLFRASSSRRSAWAAGS